MRKGEKRKGRKKYWKKVEKERMGRKDKILEKERINGGKNEGEKGENAGKI